MSCEACGRPATLVRNGRALNLANLDLSTLHRYDIANWTSAAVAAQGVVKDRRLLGQKLLGAPRTNQGPDQR